MSARNAFVHRISLSLSRSPFLREHEQVRLKKDRQVYSILLTVGNRGVKWIRITTSSAAPKSSAYFSRSLNRAGADSKNVAFVYTYQEGPTSNKGVIGAMNQTCKTWMPVEMDMLMQSL